MDEPVVHCPKCGSTQITANKKGFSGTKAVAGAVITGGIGLLAGTIGSNKIKITCLNCGKVFAPGEGLKAGEITANEKDLKMKEYLAKNPPSTGCYVFLILIFVIIVFGMAKSCNG